MFTAQYQIMYFFHQPGSDVLTASGNFFPFFLFLLLYANVPKPHQYY